MSVLFDFPVERIAREMPGAQDADRAAELVYRHGFDSFAAVVAADRTRPGRELSDIIHAGYPLDRFEAFLRELAEHAS